ncbi:MAG: hypothetical protein HOY79_03000 [Streptomyces sp.]|nr:hypothetical protein [Streptomyces sp.]
MRAPLLATMFGAARRDGLGRVYRQTTAYTRHRLAEMAAPATVRPYGTRTGADQSARLPAQRDPHALGAGRAAARLLPDGQQAPHAPGAAHAASRPVPEVEQHMPAGPARADVIHAFAE